ncbi:MAG TPA: RtcB family protein, partial [Cyclobacteriaceae bacterium]|nr:RtcB family protein [Cyclobacteriaceae bacterium]
MKLTGNDLLTLGFAEGKAMGIALAILEKEYASLSIEEQSALLKKVIENPAAYTNDKNFATLANALMPPIETTIALHEGKQYQIYGAEAIEDGAIAQMQTAMKLPIAVSGALMPDAHQGYGLPIGGVLATNNAVIPYGVGVDIGCRMCLTLYDLPV